jgi:hypothetical protein
LLLFFNLPMVSPLFALAANSDVNLPACCRRNGIHHCNMQMQRAASSGAAFSGIPTKCPAYPRPATLVRITHAQVNAEAIAFITPGSVLTIKSRAQTSSKISTKSAHPKRGPPSLTL